MTNLGGLMNGEIVAAWDENGADVEFVSATLCRLLQKVV